MLLASVFLVSLSSLAIEILLARAFSFSQWNHLSFMVISVVLFGFGASGSLLALIEGRRPGWTRGLVASGRYSLLILLFCASAVGALEFIRAVPLDYFRMPLQPLQLLFLGATYLVLLLPFLCAGGVISAAFAVAPARSGWIYGASMAGSALGALLPVMLLPRLGVGASILVCAAFPLAAALVAAVAPRPDDRGSSARLRRLVPVLAVAALLAVLPALGRDRLLELEPSPYKLLAQTMQFPGSRILATRSTLRGRVDGVESPALRFAPGLSLQYQGLLPGRELFIRDADGLYALYRVADPEFARYTHGYAGVLLPQERGRALLLQAGGGLGLPLAAAGGFPEVSLLIDHPWIASEAARLYAGKDGPVRPEAEAGVERLRVEGGNLRRILGRSRERFDLIHLEHWGPSIPGMASLNQEHLLTVEAFRQYIGHLSPTGVLVLSRRLLLPPSDSLRLYAAVYRALEETGVRQPERHLAMVHGFDSFSMLCSAAPLDPPRLEALRGFCRELNFDTLYYHGMPESEVGRFNRFEEPFHFRELQALERALAQGRQREYFSGYFLDVSPATDDRPFHNRFTRISRIGSLYRATGSRFYLLLMSGETVVLAVLAVALTIGLLLLGVPALTAARRRRRDSPRHSSPGSPRGLMLYFLATGGGFMLVEMALIQSFTHLLGDPIVAFTAVLAGLLVASGLGAASSARWSRPALVRSLGVLVAAVALWAWLGGGVVQRLLVASPVVHWGGAVALLAAFGFLLGVPFPTALRHFGRDPGQLSYLWAANGIASVVASILAVPVAMSWGTSRVLWLAGVCYAVSMAAAALMSGARRGGQSGTPRLTTPPAQRPRPSRSGVSTPSSMIVSSRPPGITARMVGLRISPSRWIRAGASSS